MYISPRLIMGNFIHDTYLENPNSSNRSRLSVAMLASIALHVSFAWLLTFNHFEPAIPQKEAPQIMDVVLLDESQSSSTEKNNQAQTIANKNSKGRSANAQDNRTRSARSPLLGNKKKQPNKPQPTQPSLPKSPLQPKQQQKKPSRLLTLDDHNSPSLLPPDETPSEEHKKKASSVPYIPLANLMPSAHAFAQLSRDFDREKRLKQMLSQEADIGINTREAKYAPYAQGLVRSLEEQWRPEHEGVKQLQQTDRQVMMRVSIGHNGALENIEILKPSPSSQLNDSAVAAVYASAPFKPLPSSWGLERAHFYFVFEVVEDKFVFRTL
ncbi:MAG: TonB family protein [Ghiorsea sp.]